MLCSGLAIQLAIEAFDRDSPRILFLYQILSKPLLTLSYLPLPLLRVALVCFFLIQMLLAQVLLQFWCIPHYP
jgi:hypothetical protein